MYLLVMGWCRYCRCQAVDARWRGAGGRVASAADAATSANRCAPLRCLPTTAITHLYGHPDPPAPLQGGTWRINMPPTDSTLIYLTRFISRMPVNFYVPLCSHPPPRDALWWTRIKFHVSAVLLSSTFIGRNRWRVHRRKYPIGNSLNFKRRWGAEGNNNFFLQFRFINDRFILRAVQLTLVTFLPSQALCECGSETKCRPEMCNFFTNIAEGRRSLPLACLDGFYANRGDLLGFLLARQLFTVCGRGSPFKKLAVGSGPQQPQPLNKLG